MYSIILADPPWKYSFSKTKNRKIENHYPTMKLKDIIKIPVRKIANKNSVLFLWVTAPKLEEGMILMKEWGFKYKTHGIWDKEKIGMGYWFRGQHELILVGVRGKFSPPPPSLRISSIKREKRTAHSRKPDYIHDYIDLVYPDHPKVEIFARRPRDGWKTIGHDIDQGRSAEEVINSISCP